MSSSMRESGRSMEAAYNGFVRRMVNLPRNVLGGFSRAMNQGIDRMVGNGGRRNQHNQSFPFQEPYFNNFPLPQPLIQEEWAFLSAFEQEYGTMHPFFYACRFTDALKIARDEHKFMFMYIHSPEHPFTPNFCRETLCSEIVVQFLDANFVSWGGVSSRGEGLQMASTLRVASYPFCAIVAPASTDNLAVLQQVSRNYSESKFLLSYFKVMEY